MFRKVLKPWGGGWGGLQRWAASRLSVCPDLQCKIQTRLGGKNSILHITLFSKGEDCRCCLKREAGQIQPEQSATNVFLFKLNHLESNHFLRLKKEFGPLLRHQFVQLRLFLCCLMDAAQLNHVGSVTNIVSKVSSAWSKQRLL